MDLLERLLKRNQGTNQVEQMVKDFKTAGGRILSEESLRKERLRMRKSHMKDKVNDSRIQLARARQELDRRGYTASSTVGRYSILVYGDSSVKSSKVRSRRFGIMVSTRTRRRSNI